MSNYYFTDNISFEMKAGIPPKVDLQGKGEIYAPFSAIATPQIDVEPTGAFAPTATTLGFTYAFNDKWFATGLVSYAHMQNQTIITVCDR